LCGLEEGLFPHQRSLDEPGGLEEERRLCYVGMTRAMQRLVLSWAEVRRLHGREHYTSPSRFLAEMPPELIEEIRVGISGRRRSAADPARDTVAPSGPTQASADAIQLGGRVQHARFGPGTVVMVEGQGEHARVQVCFEKAGSKWLVLAYAKLEPC
jgi:DNA helicase-2/ATP-dependent DNA helicase PcrA